MEGRRTSGICTCGSDRRRDGRCCDCGRSARRTSGHDLWLALNVVVVLVLFIVGGPEAAAAALIFWPYIKEDAS